MNELDSLNAIDNSRIDALVDSILNVDVVSISEDAEVVSDTLVQQFPDINPANDIDIINEAVQSISSGSGNVGLAIAIIGLLIFAAHLFTEIFSRKRIPDVLLLMIIGLIIGPVFNWIKPESLGSVGSVFSQLTLVILLFESGTQLTFNSLTNSIKQTSILTFSTFIAVFVVIGLLGWLCLGMSPTMSFMLGAAIGGTSSAVVIPTVNQISIGERSKTIVILESAFNAALCIVVALAILESYKIGKIQFGQLFGRVFSSFVLATLIGLLGAIFWGFVLERVRNIKNSIFTTPAFVFIIYGINEMLGYSGAIASLAFGIGLANIETLYKTTLKKFSPRKPSQLNQTEKLLFSELVFLMKTFFFIYIGICIRLDDLKLVLIGFGIAVIVFIVRIPVVYCSLSRKHDDISDQDRSYVAALVPKGLASAVLATMIAQTSIPGAQSISTIVYSVILFSIIISSVLIPLIEKYPAVMKFYVRCFDLFDKISRRETAVAVTAQAKEKNASSVEDKK